MTDREPVAMTPFEARLGRELRTMSDVALRRGAASEVAERAIAARRSRGLLGWPASPRIVAVFALVAILLASAAFLLALAGQKPVHPLSATGRLAYITADRSFNGAVAHITVPDGTGPDIATVDTGFVLWSPSGRFLVVEGGARDEPDHASYLVLDPDGRQVGHITAGQNASVSWAPVSDRLVVASQTPTGPWLRIYGPTGDVQRDLTVPAGVTKLLDPALSPDERRVLVNGCSTCLLSAHDGKYDYIGNQAPWVIDVDGRVPPIRLTDDASETAGAASWRSDDEIAFTAYCDGASCPTAPDGTLLPTRWQISPDGTNRHRDSSAHPYGLRSPDGVHVAFTDAQWLVVSNVDGSEPLRLTSAGTGQSAPTSNSSGWPVAWSPDGARILYVRVNPNRAVDGLLDDGSLRMVDATGTGDHLVSATAQRGAWQPVPVPTP